VAAEVAPSDELRKAFHAGELDFAGSPSVTSMNWPLTPSTGTRCWTWRKGDLTLLYAGKDTEHNNARVLADWLEDELQRRGPGSSPVCYAPAGLPAMRPMATMRTLALDPIPPCLLH
jgi:hypothetical protein